MKLDNNYAHQGHFNEQHGRIYFEL